VQQTNSMSKLQVPPTLTWMFSSVLGGVFAATGLFVITIFGQPAILSCQRTAPNLGTCKLVASNFPSREEVDIPLNELQGAKVNEDTDLVMLLTNNQEVAFTSYSITNESEEESIAHRINNFVKNPNQKTLIVHKDNSQWFHYALGGSLIAAGLYCGVYRLGRKKVKNATGD